jgi:UV DNA damage endonuclease
MRLGLCCTFQYEPIRFRTTTATYLARLEPARRTVHLRELVAHNASALQDAVQWCAAHGVGAFRITSGLLPIATHPALGYRLDTLDPSGTLESRLAAAGELARELCVRLSFHPDQFVVPGSSREEVVQQSLRELEHLGSLAELVGAEQLTLHGGGARGGKGAALERLARAIGTLRPAARSRLALENDDRIYTVRDLLPLCETEGIPLVYDVHHHRCHPDGLGVEEATEAAASTWSDREPWAHVSSPKGGWGAPNPRLHADRIDPADVPGHWLRRALTVDVEAKDKERAVLALGSELGLEMSPNVRGPR